MSKNTTTDPGLVVIYDSIAAPIRGLASQRDATALPMGSGFYKELSGVRWAAYGGVVQVRPGITAYGTDAVSASGLPWGLTTQPVSGASGSGANLRSGLSVSYTKVQFPMILSALAACMTLAAPGAQDAPVDLGRVFVKGEKLGYKVRSNMHAESRNIPIRTWIPEQTDINYEFSLTVQEMKSDGIAVIRYQRPTMTIIDGETFTAPSKTQVEKVNYDSFITLSPLNEILDAKDAPKPKAKVAVATALPTAGKPQVQAFLSQFISEMYRMTLFVGSLDSSLDFMPKLRTTQVKVGDTWLKTFAYQPQKLKGKDGKTVVQRIDFNYVYKGPVTVNGKTFQRIEASYNLDTDLSQFVNDTFGVTSADTGLIKLPMKLASKVEFDLDMTTHHCVEARAVTEGGFEVFEEGTPEGVPAYESKLKGRTTLLLVGRKVMK